MTWNIVSVDQHAPLSRAAEVMETAHISSVLVTAAPGPVGIITERDILYALEEDLPGEPTVATAMSWPLVSVCASKSVREAYHLMTERGVRHLLVSDEHGKPAGIVSESDFRFHLGIDFYHRLQDVGTVMCTQTPLLGPDASLRQAVAEMSKRGAECVVIAEAGRPLGILTERDAVRLYRQGGALDSPLAALMTTPVASIALGARVHDALDLMRERRIRHLVVCDAVGQMSGVLSEHGVVRQLENEYLEFALRENRATHRRLHDSEMRRRAVFDLANEFMGLLDPDGTLRDLNRSALALIGKQAGDVIGKPFWDTPWWSHDSALQARLRQAVADLAQGKTSRFEATHPGLDGTLRHVDFRLQPIFDDDGELVLALAEGNDVTERKRIEGELRQFQRAVEQCPVSIIITDTQARIQYVNPKFSAITGYSLDEVRGHNPRLLQSGLTPRATYDALWATLAEGGVWAGELCNRHKNGDIFWELAHILPITDPDGQPTHYLALKEDITERRRVDEERRLALSVFQSSHDGILITDPDGLILDVNRAFSELTGYQRGEAAGHSFRLLSSGHHDDEFFRRIFETAAQNGCWQGEMWSRTKDGAVTVVLMTLSAVRDKEERLTQYVGVFTDITQKKESEQRMERLAHYDALTDLPNRSLFRDRLQQAMKTSQRESQALALFFIDLDHFKEVNDTLGHVAGDQLLVEASRRIVSCVRGSDTVARLGGDEFTVILPDLEDREAVERVAQSMIWALAAPFRLGQDSAYVSASIGIALYPYDGDDTESLIDSADRAMYDAKEQGRNGFSFFCALA